MSIDTLATAVIALAVIGLLIYRQLRWRAFDPSKALRLPVILGAIGVLQLAQLHGARVTTVDAVLLGIELLLSVGVGAAMGRLTAFRSGPDGVLQVRTGPAGAALWAVLIAVRIGFDAVGASLGAHLLTQTGVILVLIAASRATASLITRAREPQRAFQSA